MLGSLPPNANIRSISGVFADLQLKSPEAEAVLSPRPPLLSPPSKNSLFLRPERKQFIQTGAAVVAPRVEQLK